MTRVLRSTSLVLWLVVAGCGSALDPVLASKPDYEAYRKTRLADSVEARLVASERYLYAHPQGRFQAEVRRYFTEQERIYWQSAQKDLSGLRRYLDALPNGPHAQEASERIAELELAAQIVRRRDEQLTESARAVEEKLADARAMRQALVDTLTGFSRHLAGIRSFGQPTSALDHELIYAWRISEPAARCIGDTCVKALALPYAIPDSGRLSPRKALLDVVIELERGNVVRALIAGPELFSRVGEAIELRPIRPRDSQARAEAIARSLGAVALAIESALPEARCAREPVSPVVLERRCDGIVFRMIAAASVETDDRVEVFPEPAP